MLRLIKVELFKLFKNKTFRVLGGVCCFIGIVVMVMASPIVTDIMLQQLEDFPIEQQELLKEAMEQPTYNEEVLVTSSLGLRLQTIDPFNPTAVEVFYSSFGEGIFEVLLGILVGALFAKEYSSGTFKNVLAYGQKRSHVYLAKFIASSIGLFILLAIQVIVPTILYTVLFGWKEVFEISQLNHLIGSFLVSYLAFASIISLMMLISTLVKSQSGVIGSTICIFLLLNMIFLSFYGSTTWFDQIFECTPLYNTRVATSISAVSTDWIRSILLSMLTIGICLVGGIKIFKVQDIK